MTEVQIRRHLQRNQATGRGPQSLYQLAKTWDVSRCISSYKVMED